MDRRQGRGGHDKLQMATAAADQRQTSMATAVAVSAFAQPFGGSVSSTSTNDSMQHVCNLARFKITRCQGCAMFNHISQWLHCVTPNLSHCLNNQRVLRPANILQFKIHGHGDSNRSRVQWNHANVSGSEKLSPSSVQAQLFLTQQGTITSTIYSFALLFRVPPVAYVAQA